MDPDFLTFLRLVEPAAVKLTTTTGRGVHLDGVAQTLCPVYGALEIVCRLGARLRIAPGQGSPQGSPQSKRLRDGFQMVSPEPCTGSQ